MSSGKRGRPTNYEPWMVIVAERMYELGATHGDVAHALDRAESTIRRWLEDRSDFSAALKAREFADAEVVRSLFQRAKGYTTSDGVHVPAHPTAIIYWLKNRQPGKWRDRHEIEPCKEVDAPANIEAVAEQLITQVTINPTLGPVLRQWAERLIARLPATS